MSVWLGEEVQALLRCQNVATNNGLAFSETELISAENMCGYEDMHAREQLREAFWDVRLKGRTGSQVRAPRTIGRRWLTARPRGGQRG